MVMAIAGKSVLAGLSRPVQLVLHSFAVLKNILSGEFLNLLASFMALSRRALATLRNWVILF